MKNYIKDIKDISGNTTKSHVENYCKQQNVVFPDNGIIKKTDLNSKGLHLHECGSSKLAKNLLDFVFWICKPGSSVSHESEVSDNCFKKALRHFKRTTHSGFHWDI